jgi:hypothetical protein
MEADDLLYSRNERSQKGRGNRQTVVGRVEVLENEWFVSAILEVTIRLDEDEKEGELAEWVTYKNHQIKACSQHLGDDRWMPKALAWLSMGGRAPMKTLQGESHEVSNTESKANVIALGKAKKWVDQHQ